MNFVSFLDACRFCNWLQHRQPSGPETRERLERLMMPCADKLRSQMLDELPIALRRELEAKKEKLAEEGTE